MENTHNSLFDICEKIPKGKNNANETLTVRIYKTFVGIVPEE